MCLKISYMVLYDTSVTYFPYSGQLADRSNLRYYLTVGMLGGCGCNDTILHHQTGSAMSTSLLGLTYFFNVHQLFYFILVQVRTVYTISNILYVVLFKNVLGLDFCVLVLNQPLMLAFLRTV